LVGAVGDAQAAIATATTVSKAIVIRRFMGTYLVIA
jgi:hypothetical protein